MIMKVLELLLVFTIVSVTTEGKLVCYHGSWAAQRRSGGKFTSANIDPFLCTHLIYAFVGVYGDNGSVIPLEPENNIGAGYLKLKQKNHKLKTLLAVGGWNEGSVNYSKIVGNVNLRAEFIRSALNLLEKYNFDGFDLDWEYPAQRGGAPEDKENFITLIKEMSLAFNKKKLITAAVAATGTGVDISYDVPELNKHIDWIHLMTYDLHGTWDGVTGHNAPLYASSIDTSESAKLLNVAASVEGWIKRGMDPNKIVLGMPLYGRTYTLNSTDVSLGAPINGAGVAGEFTKEAGTLSYYEICLRQQKRGWKTVWDDEQKVPHMYKDNQWISYDNIKSLKQKVKYANKVKLGGAMVWAIDLDDFRGEFDKIKYPLLKAIKRSLNEDPIVKGPDDKCHCGCQL